MPYASSTTFSEGNSTSIAGVAKPASTAIGDVLIAQMYLETTGVTPTIASTGDTWTPVHDTVNTATTPDMYHYVWICVVANASSTIGVTWGGGAFWRDFAVHRFTGIDTTTPQDATATENTGSSATATGLTLTTVTDDAELVLLTATFDARTQSAWSSPLTEMDDSGNVASASGVQTTAGASGSKTVTLSGTSEWSAILMALRPDGAEAPPSFVAAGTAAFTATNGATIAPGLPSGWAADDIHVLLAARSDNTAMTTLSGWDQIAGLSGNNTAAQRVEVWVRRAVGGDTAPTVTFGTGTVVRGARIYGIRGVPNTGTVADNIDVQSRLDNAASATVSFTDVNTTGTNRLILALAAYEDDATTLTDLSGYTQPTQGTKVSALGNDMGLHHQYKVLAAAGAGGGTSATISGGTFTNSVNVGILIAFKPIPVGGGEERAVAGAMPAATGTLTRVLGAVRAVAGAQPTATGTLARVKQALRSLAGAQPAATGTLVRKLTALRSAAGVQPAGTGTLAAAVTFLRSVAGAQPASSGALTYLRGYLRTLTGAMPPPTGTLVRSLGVFARAVAGAQPYATGALARILSAARTVAGSQPAPTGALDALVVFLRDVAGSQPAATGALTYDRAITRLLTGSQPAGTGSLTRLLAALRSLTGAQPTGTGTLTRSAGRTRSLTGSQPTATGTLAGQQSVGRAPAGAQPYATGTLGRLLAAFRALTGSQPAPSGILARVLATARALTGSQPAATGTLARSAGRARSLTGSQPAASGTLAGQFTASRTVSGSQPAATGSLALLLAATRHLVGTQPEPTGTLTRSYAATESLAGVQPAPTGEVSWFLGTPMEGPSATILVVRRAVATATVVRRSGAAGSVVRRPVSELVLVGR